MACGVVARAARSDAYRSVPLASSAPSADAARTVRNTVTMPPPSVVAKWTVEDVCAHVKALGADDAVLAALRRERIAGAQLLAATDMLTKQKPLSAASPDASVASRGAEREQQ